MLKDLANETLQIQQQDLSPGDASSANSMAYLGMALGDQLRRISGPVTELVGISIEKKILPQLDPAGNYDFLGCPVSEVQVELDQQGSVVNPTGTWRLITLSVTGQAAPPQTLKLKLEGGKLTGTLSRQAGNKVEQLPLEDAKLKGSDLSFATQNYAVVYLHNVLQPTDTNKWSHSKFQGTISGDTIKGKVERESYLGNNPTLDWEAKRVP